MSELKNPHVKVVGIEKGLTLQEIENHIRIQNSNILRNKSIVNVKHILEKKK